LKELSPLLRGWDILSARKPFHTLRMVKRSKVEPIRNPTLLEMDKLEKAADLVTKLKVDSFNG
jgi:hypothetical protein